MTRFQSIFPVGVAALLPASPLVSYLAHNRDESFQLSWIVLLYVAMVLGGVLVAAAVRAFTKNESWQRAWCSYAGLGYMIFLYGAVKQLLRTGIGGMPTSLVIVLWTIVALLVVALLWRISAHRNGQWAIASFALLAVVFPLASIAKRPGSLLHNVALEFNLRQAGAATPAPVATPGASSAKLPNVYFFILDGYLRSDFLRSHYGYDNSAFDTALARKDFRINRHSWSNFPVTRLSVNQTLNPSLNVAEVGAGPKENVTNPLMGSYLSKSRSQVQERFESLGYTFVMLNHQGKDGPACRPHCIETKSASYERIQLLKTTPFYDAIRIVFPDVLGGWIAAVPTDPMLVLRERWTSPPAPYVVFAHLLIPHPPFAVESDCSARPLSEVDYDFLHELSSQTPSELRRLYLNQVACVNARMLRAIDRILKRDPTAFILVQSDHGWKFTYSIERPALPEEAKLQVQMRLANLSAYRAPARCRHSFYDGFTAINTFPLVFACLTGEKPALQPDRMYMVGDHNALYEVTSLLRRENGRSETR
jgi:hypothetical protein